MASDDVLGTSVFLRGKSPTGNLKNLVVDDNGNLLIAFSTTVADVVSLSTSSTNPVTPSVKQSTGASITSVSGSTTRASVVAANSARRGLSISSESTSTGTALVAFSSTASLTSWTVPVPVSGFYEMPEPIWTGEMSVIHISGVSTLRVTELS